MKLSGWSQQYQAAGKLERLWVDETETFAEVRSCLSSCNGPAVLLPPAFGPKVIRGWCFLW